METRIHPTFQKTLQKRALITYLSCVASFISSLVLHNYGFERAGWLMALLFFACTLAGIYSTRQYMHAIACLICGKTLRTSQDHTGNYWLAKCEHCQIEWDLQTGVD